MENTSITSQYKAWGLAQRPVGQEKVWQEMWGFSVPTEDGVSTYKDLEKIGHLGVQLRERFPCPMDEPTKKMEHGGQPVKLMKT